MSRIEKSLAIVLSSAAALTGAQAAEAKTAESAKPKTTEAVVIALAKQALKHKTVPGKTNNQAVYTEMLPHDEEAVITVGSPDIQDGRPNPEHPTYLEIDVHSTEPTHGYMFPLLDLAFQANKGKDGGWRITQSSGVRAESSVAAVAQPYESVVVSVDGNNGETYVNTLNANGTLMPSTPVSVPNPAKTAEFIQDEALQVFAQISKQEGLNY